MTAVRTLDTTLGRPVDTTVAPARPAQQAAPPALDPRARRTVLVWRLRRSLARRIVRL